MGLDHRDFPPQFRKQIERQLHGKINADNSGMGATKPERQPTLEDQYAPQIRSMGASQPSHRVRIIMHRCGKPLDGDNEEFSTKAIRDGLVSAQLIPGDAKSETDFVIESIRVKTRKEIKTIIEVESV